MALTTDMRHRRWRSPHVLLAALFASGCAQPTPIETVPRVDIERFIGRWYVVASIPTFLERGAHNAVETYQRDADGSIATTFSFRRDSFDGPLVEYRPRGYVRDESAAIWGMRFVWPFEAEYRIVYLASDYSLTVIGRTKRDYVWVMARAPEIPAADYARVVTLVREFGYDITELEMVPQRW
jgi:apolipoprotein D and lipocalin family protein